jgi:zinc protease
MAAQPSFFFQQELYAYLMRTLGLTELFNWKIPGRRTMSWLIKKYKERFANAGDFESLEI